jgi:hypothetical protein
MNKQKLITTLLKGHLTHTFLIDGLRTLGFQADDYNLHLSDVIFELLDIENEDDELFEKYIEWCDQIIGKDILSDKDLLDSYVKKIYERLLKEANRKRSKKKGTGIV